MRGNGGRGSRTNRHFPDGSHGGSRQTAKETPASRQARLLEAAADAAEKRKAAVSGRKSAKWEKDGEAYGRRKVGDLVVGEKVRGTVRNLVRHGAYVDIGAKRDGLCHLREMCVDFVYDSGDIVQEGMEVDVWVKYIDAEKNVVGLTMLEPKNGGRGFSGRLAVKDVIVGERYEGRVVRVTNYGAFVDIGAERHGFVHVSALWGRRPRETLEDLRLGREIWVHVEEVDEVKSFITLRARGRRGEDALLSEVGEEDDDSGEEEILGADLAEDVTAVERKVVLQRFGQELTDDEEVEDDEDEEDEEDEYDEFELDVEQKSDMKRRPNAEEAYALVEGGLDEDEFGDEEVEGEVWSEPEQNNARFSY